MTKPAPGYRPESMPALTTYLWFNGNCARAIELYTRIFGAREVVPRVTDDSGRVMHVVLHIGDTPLMLADAWPGGWERAPEQSASASLWLYVEDCDHVFGRAVEVGFEVMLPLADAFWGDRFGKVKDHFGHVWSIATWKWQLEPDELERRKAEWMNRG